MKKPLISVLMTIYNHEIFLKSSITSIINQSFKNWELIAIENGSTDNSREILKNIKNKKIKKIFLKKNIGRTNALNYGIKLCKSKYIAILDSDDLAKKNRLEIQLKRFKNDENLFFTSSSYELINEKNKSIQKKTIKEKLYNSPRKLFFNNFIAHSTVMYKRELIKKIGYYPTNYKYAQDYAFYLKIFKKYKMEIIEKQLTKVRYIHKNSETFRQSKTNLIILEEIKLLIWVYKNFYLTNIEKINFCIFLIKKILKLIKFNYYLILIPLIIFFFIFSFFE